MGAPPRGKCDQDNVRAPAVKIVCAFGAVVEGRHRDPHAVRRENRILREERGILKEAAASLREAPAMLAFIAAAKAQRSVSIRVSVSARDAQRILRGRDEGLPADRNPIWCCDEAARV